MYVCNVRRSAGRICMYVCVQAGPLHTGGGIPAPSPPPPSDQHGQFKVSFNPLEPRVQKDKIRKQC